MRRRQVCHQRLEGVAGDIEELITANPGPGGQPIANQNKPPRVRPIDHLVLDFGHIGVSQTNHADDVVANQMLDGHGESGHDNVRQVHLLPKRQQLRHAKTAVRANGAQPHLEDQKSLGQDCQQRMRAGFDVDAGMAGLDSFLMAVLMEQSRRIQVEGIALAARGRSLQHHRQQRPETSQVHAGRGEDLEKTRKLD